MAQIVPFPSSSTSSTRCRPAGRRLDAVAADALRTVPRDVDREDGSSRPAVDLDVWTRHVRYERSGAPEDLAALVEEYTAYAMAIAHRLYRRGEAKEDLEQVALEALVVALQRFSTERGIPFAAFATPTITGAVKRHYRDRGWAIRAPRQVHDLAGPIRTAREDLAGVLGRPATIEEVASHVGVEVTAVTQVEQAVQARSVASLDLRHTADGPTLGDAVGTVDERLASAVDRVALAEALEVLTEREREIVSLYFVGELSQREIAAQYGVSQMQVSRWLKLIIGRLRARMAVPA